MTTAVFLEGLPGVGKTSIMVTLATELGEMCLAIPEANPPPTQPDMFNNKPTESVTAWYLHRELRRDRLAARLTIHERPRIALFDRSYLSVLAYCYAVGATTGRTNGYRYARGIFDDQIRPGLTSNATILMLMTTVDESLDRRRDKLDREFEHQWYSRGFLEALQDFYNDEAPRLAGGSLRLLRTDAIASDRILASVLCATCDRSLTRDLDAEFLVAPLVPRLQGAELSHDGIRRFYESHGGSRTFGQPLGNLVNHYAGTTQFFERHGLLIESSGVVGVLDPAAKDCVDRMRA